MKPFWALKNFSVAMLLLLTTSITNADELSGHISGFIGLKTMSNSDWPDIDKHFSMGINFDFKKDSWPISIALDLMDTGSEHSHDNATNRGHSTEYHLGVRKIFVEQHSKILPYFGGGVSFMYAELEYETNNQTMTEDDRDIGIWLGAGMYYAINPKFVLGLDARYSYGKVLLFNKERKAGGVFTGVTAGYQF